MAPTDALLLIGHGSERYPDAGAAMCLHANTLRSANRFARVEVALLHGAPSVDEALARIGVRSSEVEPTSDVNRPLKQREPEPDGFNLKPSGSGTTSIRVVPFFMEDGYFTRVALPRALRDRPVRWCPPIGVHDGIAGLIERQALAACASRGLASRTAAVLVVGHGSRTAPGRDLALHRHVSRVAATELFARVEAACLEEAPFVADALLGLRAHPVVVIGFFANEGGHVRDDLPELIAAEQAARGDIGLAVQFHGSVSGQPAMAGIILDQASGDETGE